MRETLIFSMVIVLHSVATFAQAPVSESGRQPGSPEQRLERIESMLQSQGLLDMLQQLEQLQQEISLLRGEVETQRYNLEQLTNRQRDLYTDVDQRIQRLETGSFVPAEQRPEALPGPEITDSPPLEVLSPRRAADTPTSTVPAENALRVEIVDTAATAAASGTRNDTIGISAENDTADRDSIRESIGTPAANSTARVDPLQLQAEYQQAFNLLKQSLYDQAIRAFQQFLATYPQEQYADNAQYWLAEAYYVKREFEPALTEYRKVLSNYPHSQKLNDARLKIGFALHELGDLEAARQQLQEILQQQPDSAVARLAGERLKLIETARSTP